MIGKQIRFFLTPTDEKKILEEIKKNGDLLSTNKGENIDKLTSTFLNDNSISQVWIKSPYSKIYFSPNGLIDRDKSEILEYTRSVSDLFFTPLVRQKTTFEEYVSTIRGKREGTLSYRKGKFIRPDDIPLEELKKEYELLINNRNKKNEKVLENGRLWAAMKFLDGDKLIKKSDWFKDWYESYVLLIKNCCKLSEDKMAYIGIDAYKEYKKGRYIIDTVNWN